MIHVVTQQNRAFYKAQLEQMHRMRREVFIVGRGWCLQERDGGEYDRGDDEQAVYLMMLDEDGTLQVSVRARPVMDWSILLDEMPGCAEGQVEALRRPDVWEMARHLATGQGRSAGEARERAAEFRIALLEAALARGITQLVGTVDVGLMAHGIRAWLQLKPLGLPVVYPEGGAAVGYTIPVTRALIDEMRSTFKASEPAAYEFKPVNPAIGLSPADIEQALRFGASQRKVQYA